MPTASTAPMHPPRDATCSGAVTTSGSDASDGDDDGDGGTSDGGDGGEGDGGDGGAGAGRLRALDPPLADGYGHRFVRCGGGGLGRPVSLDTHRLGRPSYLLTVLVGRCTAST